MKRIIWLIYTTVISFILVLLFFFGILCGYFGLKGEWRHNDGWSHRPFEEFLVHADFVGDIVSATIYLVIILAVFWLISCLSLLIVNKLIESNNEKKRLN